MMSPGAIAIVVITVMLWIVWSDQIRSRRPTPVLYVFRIVLFLIVCAVLIMNMVRYPALIAGSSRVLTIVAVGVGLVGVGYFARRLVLRR